MRLCPDECIGLVWPIAAKGRETLMKPCSCSIGNWKKQKPGGRAPAGFELRALLAQGKEPRDAGAARVAPSASSRASSLAAWPRTLRPRPMAPRGTAFAIRRLPPATAAPNAPSRLPPALGSLKPVRTSSRHARAGVGIDFCIRSYQRDYRSPCQEEQTLTSEAL